MSENLELDRDIQPPGGDLPLESLRAWLGIGHRLVRSWTTKNAHMDLYEPRSGAGPELLVKLCPGWDGRNALTVFETFAAIRKLAADQGLPQLVPPVLWWGSDPAYVCSEWVAGNDLRTRIFDVYSNDGGDPFAECMAMVTVLGSHLQRYHSAMALAGPELDGHPWKSSELRQTGMAVTIARWLAGAESMEAATEVRSIDDPGPHNVIADSADRMWLIDLPAHRQLVPVENDLARMASRLVGAVRRASKSRWRPRADMYAQVVDALVAGYSGPGSEPVELNRSLIDAYLAADALHKVRRTYGRMPPGTRIEAFFRESLAGAVLGARALRRRWSRRRPAAT